MTRQRLAPEVRRRQVLDAAVAVFSEVGVHSASMEAIAARAGVSKPMVYAHGGSKDALFAACLEREAARLVASMTEAAAAAGPDPQMRLYLGLRAFFHAVTTRRRGWTVLYRQAAAGEFAGVVDARRREIIGGATALLARDLEVDHDAVAPFAHTLVGAAEGLADWWLDGRRSAAELDPGSGEHPDVDADVLARTVMTVAWPGLDALREGRVWEPPIGVSTSLSDRG